jgi:hypothetical protein
MFEAGGAALRLRLQFHENDATSCGSGSRNSETNVLLIVLHSFDLKKSIFKKPQC